MKKLVTEFEEMPRFYGFAYYNYVYRCAVCYPIPINFIVRLFLPLWLYCKYPGPSFWEKNTYVIDRFTAPIKRDGELTYIDLSNNERV